MSSLDPREVAEGYRLSPPQRRYWRLCQADPDADLGVQACVRADGPLDAARLGAAVARMRGRYDILRARVARLEGTGLPVQVTDDTLADHAAGTGAGLDEVVDLSASAADAQAAARDAIRRIQWRQVRAQERGAAVRFTLVRLAEREHELIITASALCADASSLLIVAQQIASAYDGASASDDRSPRDEARRSEALPDVAQQNGAEPAFDRSSQDDSLQDEPLQYADLSEWQNQMIDEPPGDAQAPYWTDAAFADLAFPRLPFELRPPAGDPHAAARTSSREHLIADIPGGVTMRLRTAASLRATLFAAWGLVLHRLSRATRFLVGVQVDGRSEAELRDAVGPLARTLPIAIDAGRHASAEALAAHLQQALAMAEFDQFLFAWEPFGLPAPREQRHLFPVILRMREQRPFETAPLMARGQHGPVRWTPIAIDEQSEPCDLSVTLIDTGAALQVELAWSPSVYARRDMRIAMDLYLALLEQIAAGARIGDAVGDAVGQAIGHDIGDAIGDAEAARECDWPAVGSMPAWSAADDLFSPVHEQIAAHARRTPQAIAVREGTRSITYGELLARADLLADRLRELGVGREQVVAIVAERSIAFIAGMLAVLRTGAAWLPIEPETPDERLRDMLAQAGAVAVLTQRGVSLPSGIGEIPVCSLHPSLTDPSPPRSQPQLQPPSQPSSLPAGGRSDIAADPRDLAYVIFTSGSTGRPKGVAIEHGQLAAYFRAFLADDRVRACRHFALVSTIAADLGHSSVFGALCTGGCLHIVSRALASDADALAAYFVAHEVDGIKIVPTHLDALCASFPPDVRLPWRCAVLGGETLSWDLLDRTTRLAPDCTVINEYGPTETAVGVVITRGDLAAEPFLSAYAPIGEELPGAHLYVLDPDLRPLPPWIEGELFIGGAFVGRGYVGRGDLTADRFMPDPFSPRPGARMYRTGDRVRRRSDAAFEFLGRRDGQVKIRGYRVELDEIETALRLHPDVQMAAARAVDAAGSGKQLVAWAAIGTAAAGAATVQPEALRAFLETRLPPFMIPTAIVCLDRLPLTPNGKVDRQALPLPGPQAPVRLRPPADDVEWQLVNVWQAVLNVPQIGVDDNYFALGGDSLRVIQLAHEARRAGVTITAADVLHHQTIRKLRTAMQARHRDVLFPDGPPAPAAPAQAAGGLPDDVVDAYPLSGMQRFMLEEYERNLGAQGVFHIQECLRLTDPALSLPLLQRAFAAVVDRHPVLRTIFDRAHQPPRQLVRRQVPWIMRRVDLSRFGADQQDALLSAALREDRRHLFDADDRDGPHFRVIIFERSATDVELSFSAHHALLDGWGHRVMVNQLFDAYADLKAGREPSLGAPDRTYREFVAYQEAITSSTQASAFWRRYLQGVEATPPARRARTDAEQRMILTELSPELRDGLQAAARQSQISIKALVLGCWLHALHQWSGRPIVTTGTIANGRSESLSDPMSAVGLFWNIVPLVSRRMQPPLDLAATVQTDLQEIDPHAVYPLPSIVADQGGRHPFWSCFRYLHFWNARQPVQGSGLHLADIVACDRYTFPLDCTTLLNSWRSGGWIILQHDPDTFDERQARDMLDRYRATLHEIAARAAAVTA